MTSDTPPPPNGAATVRPLVITRPSPLAPPCAVKNIIAGVVGAVDRARARHAADVQRRDRGQRRAVAARRRQRAQRLGVQHDLAAHRLRVDDRRLAR